MFSESYDDEFVQENNGKKICTICWGKGELKVPDGPHGIKTVLCFCRERANQEKREIESDPW